MSKETYISKEPAVYVLRKNRYLEGRFVHASPDHPATVELPAGYKIDEGLIPYDEYTENGPLKPHYVVKESGHAPRVTSSTPTLRIVEDAIVTKSAPTVSVSVAPAGISASETKPKRLSDKSPV